MKKEAIIRLAVLIAAIINQALIAAGHDALPWSDSEIGAGASTLITAITALWAWWKNNSITKPAIAADKVLAAIKDGIVQEQDVDGLVNPIRAKKFSAEIDGDAEYETLLGECPELAEIRQTDNGAHDGDPVLPGQTKEVDE
jgi:SPP1 family holin